MRDSPFRLLAWAVFGSFYVMVGAVPLFMWSFSLMLWYFDNRQKERLALAAIERVYNPASAETGPDLNKTSCLMKIGPVRDKVTESRNASKLDFCVDPTRLMAASGEERKFNPEGLWWLLACLKLQQGMRTITLNRTIVEICMFCYMKVAIPPRDSGPQNHFWGPSTHFLYNRYITCFLGPPSNC